MIGIDSCQGFAPHTKNTWSRIVDGEIHRGLRVNGCTFRRCCANVQEQLVLLPCIPHRVDKRRTVRLRHAQTHEACSVKKTVDGSPRRWQCARHGNNFHSCCSPTREWPLRQHFKTQCVDPRHEALLLGLTECVRCVYHWDKDPGDKMQMRRSVCIL